MGGGSFVREYDIGGEFDDDGVVDIVSGFVGGE